MTSEKNGNRWPERPTCHDDDWRVKQLRHHPEWKRHAPDKRYPHGEPFRRCSFCGSIHPEDLIAALDAGAQLGGSDWKYGWPHKFYLYEIPNEHAAELAEVGGQSYFDEEKQERVYEPHYAAQGNYSAKWYNEHIQDQGYDDATLAMLLQRLSDASGIEFRIAEGKLQYSAPYRGYQR